MFIRNDMNMDEVLSECESEARRICQDDDATPRDCENVIDDIEDALETLRRNYQNVVDSIRSEIRDVEMKKSDLEDQRTYD